MPYSLAHNDGKFAGAVATGGQFFELLRESVDFLREEGRASPRMMSVGLHMRLAGHPARAAGVARLLDYVRGCGDVWVTTRGAIDNTTPALGPAPPAALRMLTRAIEPLTAAALCWCAANAGCSKSAACAGGD